MAHIFTRRHFLKAAGLAGLVSLTERAHSFDDKAQYAPSEIRVLQGATNQNSTLITVLAHKTANVQIVVQDSKKLPWVHFKVDLIDLGLSDFIIYQVHVTEMSMGEKYSLFISHQFSSEPHVRTFRSLDWSSEKIKIAFLSCSNHRDSGPKSVMFSRLINDQPDAIFFFGDLVYANSALDTVLHRPAHPTDAYSFYVKTLMEFEFYQKRDLVPMFTMWDDHDLGYNNAESNHPYKEVMLRIFRSFFPVDSRVSGIRSGPGISYTFEAFGLQVFFFDCRSFKDSKGKEFLGSLQMEWFNRETLKQQRPLLLISSQLFWKYSRWSESYEKTAPEEFHHFQNLLKSARRPSLFISGDVHYSQVQEINKDYIGHNTYELTSSAFFSSSARKFGERSKSEGQLEYYGYANFLSFEKQTDQPGQLEALVTCWSEKTAPIFRRKLTVRANLD